jgi:hypothetical protein
MRRRQKLVAGAVGLALVAAAAGTTGALAGGEGPATGPGAEHARAAALALFEGARANSVERDGENGATWEVEVTRADGETVDVRLDADYRLVVVEGDGD